MRDIERIEADLDDAERSQHHRGVDVAHMGDPERLALQLADPRSVSIADESTGAPAKAKVTAD